MNPTKLLVELWDAGVVLTANGERLAFDAPAGVMTPQRIAALKVHKAEVMNLLPLPMELVVLLSRAPDDEARADLMYRWNERAAVMQYDGGMSRAEAEWTAMALLLSEGVGDGR